MPVSQTLQRNYTAPDLRHRINVQQASLSPTTRNLGRPIESAVDTSPTDQETANNVDVLPARADSHKGESRSRSTSSPALVVSTPTQDVNPAIERSNVPQDLSNVKSRLDYDRYNLPRPNDSNVEEEILPAGPMRAIVPQPNEGDRMLDELEEQSTEPSLASLRNNSLVHRSITAPVDHGSELIPDADHAQATLDTPAIDSVPNSTGQQTIPSPAREQLPPRANTPVPGNYTTREKSKSLKDRLRRALSLSSGSDFAHTAQLEVPNTRKGKDGRGLFALNNKSTDNISISSTASSASMMLRKMGHGLSKKTKRSFNGIFSGSKTKLGDGTTAAGTAVTVSPLVGDVSYVNAESYPEGESYPRSRAAFTGQSPAQHSMSALRSKSSSPIKAEITEAASNVDGHGSVAFPRLSEEITVDEGRSRRASMHLERPLPIDLVENFSSPRPSAGKGQRVTPVPTSNSSTLIASTYTGKGILKRTEDPLQTRSPLVAHNALPPSSDDRPPSEAGLPNSAFEISFAPTPTLDLGQFATPEMIQTPGQSPSPLEPDSPATTSPGGAGSKGTSPQSLTFCPRITIHETYTAMEYDRRGEIATCNRLTPLLAQRIKEELNAYKMDEMDVAEESRVHTHFFT
ncbi:Putative uncharacterized protein [Taphrina deformans PYCC 5710]|uniref:Uncharacterized protein n=1 Tax=Taphrina deformans (strain PYCC 5710 / ATCC 11124 / CBS 356.35 / IMI 108563 / JCM 9778 / NBRC 8474) TaxID=1097556 RepID=R4XA03_TAPDE|nr:Putative uncharacterized protein [Taphrina deformans PYCC 5710]|eukprot:CCG81089.1 Putative uncharacterized protein [Taphrina deformans PYCC 5710]